jgi:hypothetical protein
LTRKTTMELNDAARRERGLPPAISEFFHVRERWASVTNETLREAHIDARIDHRTLAAQGIDREPYPYIPHAAFQMERHGYQSGQAERLRREYLERVQSRQQSEALPDLGSLREEKPQASTQARTEMPINEQEYRRPKAQCLEDVRRQAREDWLKMREQMREPSRTRNERTNDDDLSL